MPLDKNDLKQKISLTMSELAELGERLNKLEEGVRNIVKIENEEAAFINVEIEAMKKKIVILESKVARVKK